MKLKVATAFSGGFGSVEFALKYENIDHEVVFACEWMEPQRKSYIKNHGEPTSNFYKDIRDFDGTKYKGEIDYYHLSPPCQSYSLAGKRGGASDERGGLMFEAIKSIDEVQPKMFTIENVKGLLSSNGGEDWNNIMRDIRSLPGYTITYGVMNAKEQGTPQNRERVFIVGMRADAPMMPFPERVSLDKCLADVLEDEVDKKYYLSDKAIKAYEKLVDISENCVIAQRARGVNDGGVFKISPTISTSVWEHNHALFLDGKFRRLTQREVSRLQGDFKDMFILCGTSNSYKFIGNAMDISTTRNLIKQMLKHSQNLIWNEPSEPSFIRREIESKNLFDI